MAFDIGPYKKYLYEFLTIFFGVTLAFALAKWNENQNRYESAEKTILEIRNGLKEDLVDLHDNMQGHNAGISACRIFRKYLDREEVEPDSLRLAYRILLLDFVSIQNRSGYEALKSKGLELVRDDSLRLEIISLYDFYYEIIEKMEETYSQNQYFENYFLAMNEILSDHQEFDENGRITGLSVPHNLRKEEVKTLYGFLSRIERGRRFTNMHYKMIIAKADKLIERIDESLEE